MFDSNAETREVTCTICSQWLQWCCKVRRMPQGRYPRGVLCAAPTCEQWRASRCPWRTRCPWRSTSCRRRVEPQEGEAPVSGVLSMCVRCTFTVSGERQHHNQLLYDGNFFSFNFSEFSGILVFEYFLLFSFSSRMYTAFVNVLTGPTGVSFHSIFQNFPVS